MIALSIHPIPVPLVAVLIVVVLGALGAAIALVSGNR